MRLTLPSEADIAFHKMDDAIRKASAARKRGDIERESFWMDEMRKFARMHGKAALNANTGIHTEKQPTDKEKRDVMSPNYKISAVKNIRNRKKI
jgi:hypothetical protein